MVLPIKPADLLFDLKNPRIPFQDNLAQRETLLALAREQDGAYLLALVADITEFGLSPAELPIVTPSEREHGRYEVLDGNRRLTALRALENPEALADALRPTQMDQLRKLGAKYRQAPILEIQCVVVNRREEADHWIILRHTGNNAGAGTVDWGPLEKARFKASAKGEVELYAKLLTFLVDAGHLETSELKRIPASSFRRLIETTAVQEKLGIEVLKDGSFRFHDEPATIKGLLYIANDLASKAIKVRDIDTKEQRKDYANRLPESVVPKPKTAIAPAATRGAAQKATPRVPLSRMKQVRYRLIPSGCFLRVLEPRIRQIEIELRSLDLREYVNAAAVLFRVFVELTADAYVASASLPTTPDQSLRAKLQQVTDDLVGKNRITKMQAAPVRRACAKDSFLAPSTTLMNAYVHSRDVFPAAADLRAYWDNLQPFFLAIWPR